MADLTIEALKRVLHYDPETGVFTRISKSGPNVSVGMEAGTMKDGYRFIRVKGRKYAAHRLAWFYVHGVWPPETVDHRNGRGDDNRIQNLRLASRVENGANRKLNSNSSTGFKGVTFHKASGKFRARVYRDGKVVELGGFDTPEEAARAYDQAASRVHGRFALTNAEINQ